MRVGLIDVDGHNFPNLALMKLSAYHKKLGDDVEWWQSEHEYDRVYMSKVFSNAYTPDIPEPTNTKEVIKGGSGYAISLVDGKEVYDKSLDPDLDPIIEHTYPDYTLYPEYTKCDKPLKQQIAYGYMSRGCPRGCAFCIVAKKEGKRSVCHADVKEFWNGQGKITLSDPNVLAYPEWEYIFKQLIDTGAKIDFNQGLDARLITPEKAELLASMNLCTPRFAMDSMDVIESVSRGLKLYVEAVKRKKGKWNWRNCRVFCITNFDTTFEEDMKRIKAIQECECKPYVMIYNKPSAPQLTRRLQRWTNNTMLYATWSDFGQYCRDNYKGGEMPL